MCLIDIYNLEDYIDKNKIKTILAYKLLKERNNNKSLTSPIYNYKYTPGLHTSKHGFYCFLTPSYGGRQYSSRNSYVIIPVMVKTKDIKKIGRDDQDCNNITIVTNKLYMFPGNIISKETQTYYIDWIKNIYKIKGLNTEYNV